ncbi:hypothetical protein ENHY17A_110250 [Moraxellaceae bacterium 17A]|nr:hypothetical protein ENHY17A_110250 [Moraxellaceae bacterium 17A]
MLDLSNLSESIAKTHRDAPILILASKIGKHTRQGLKRLKTQMEWQND